MIELVDVAKVFTVRRKAGRLRRTSHEVRAVDGVSLTVAAGEMVGYIGPNGAGKSTTIKMLTGILVPSSGTVRVAGLDPVRDRIELARRMGVVFGQRSQLWWDLPLAESFQLLRHIYRVPAAQHATDLDELAGLLDLGPLLAVPVRQLSLGQRMRGELAAALLHRPAVVYLDEPTIGLDVVSKSHVREFLARINAERGVTVLLTTHDLADIERLCRRMVIIDHGRVIYDGDLATIRDRVGGERTLVVDLEEPAPPLTVAGTEVVRVEGARQWLRFRRTDVSAATVVAEVARQGALVDLAIEEASIDDIVRRVYLEGLDDLGKA